MARRDYAACCTPSSTGCSMLLLAAGACRKAPMIKQILFGLWFFLPAALANMAPIFAAHTAALKKFDTPMDFGRTFRGRRILGDHKTWRGLVSGIVAATALLWLQQLAVSHFGW